MATTSNKGPLDGLRVLLCRPQGQNQPLQETLESAGAETRALPMLDIEPLPETPEQRALIQQLDAYSRIVVVSPNAARVFLELADTWWPQWPTGIEWFAVGQATAELLEAAGLHCHRPDNGHTSEDLLQQPLLQRLDEQRCLVCKGEGGRPLLSDSLRQRGARVDELTLYRRQAIHWPESRLHEDLVAFDPQVILALSVETLNNLIALGQNTDHTLYRRALLVPAERVAAKARDIGFSTVLVPAHLTPEAMLDTLADWHARH